MSSEKKKELKLSQPEQEMYHNIQSKMKTANNQYHNVYSMYVR